jgi:serine/threonine protein kinase
VPLACLVCFRDPGSGRGLCRVRRCPSSHPRPRGTQGTLKITDFGCAKRFETDAERKSGLVEDTCGTYHFFAPESCDPQAEREYNGYAVDVWALGVTFYALAYGQMPFFPEEAPNLPDGLSQELFDLISKTEPEFPDDSKLAAAGAAPQLPPGTTRGRVRYSFYSLPRPSSLPD